MKVARKLWKLNESCERCESSCESWESSCESCESSCESCESSVKVEKVCESSWTFKKGQFER